MRLVRAIALCFVLTATGLVGTAAPAVANQLAIEPGSRTVVRNTDFASFGVGGMRGSGSGSITVSGVSGTVTKALLYWNGPTNSTDPTANALVSFAGNSITGTNIGFSSDNCWLFANSQSYRADVTTFVSGNRAYALSGFRKTETVGETTTTVADINGASLIVFFHDSTPNNDRDVTMVDGNDSNFNNAFDTPGWDSTISGVDYSSGTANLQLHVSDGQSYTDGAVTLNSTQLVAAGHNFDGNTVPSAGGPDPNPSGVTGNLWDIKTYDISSFMTPGSNTLHITSPLDQDCLSLVVAMVDVASPQAFGSQDDAATFYDGTPTTIQTSRDATGGFWSKIVFPAGMTPGFVFIHEVPASTDPTYCGGLTCDAQIQFSGVPLGTASPTNPIQVFWFYTKVWKQGSTVYVQGDGEPFATVVRNCVTPGIANPPKCVSSRTILPNGDREFLLLWTNGGDPGGGKR